MNEFLDQRPSTPNTANSQEKFQMAITGTYKDGFIEGYKAIKGNSVIVPMVPMAPMTPMGQTAFRMGILAGIRAAGGM